MVSNDVAALAVGEACDALLLTAKGRILAPLVAWRRSEDELLLLTEPGLGVTVLATLTRMRLRAKCEIEAETHTGHVIFGASDGGIATGDFGVPAVEVIDAAPEGDSIELDELERMRILARRPRWGHELDDTVLPAEAGLDETAISFTKGCYPGQEPIARLHHRGHPNRTLRLLELQGDVAPNSELLLDGKVVGRVTSSASDGDEATVALGYVRREVDAGAVLSLGDGRHVRVRAG